MLAAASLSLLAGVVAVAEAPAASPVWRWHDDHVLGTSMELTVLGGEAEGWMALSAVRGEIARLDRLLSKWRDDSELARLNASSSMAVSPDLYAVASACDAWRLRTGGAFDAGRGGDVHLDAPTRTISTTAALDFDGFAKGYVIDAAVAAARNATPSVRGLMLDIGGDVRCWGQGRWLVGVSNPSDVADNAMPLTIVSLRDSAIAVSGPGARDRVIDGLPVSHLMDPFTGTPAPRIQAAVIAPTAADADALSTALAVMRPLDGIALAEGIPGVQALVVDQDGARFETTGWSAVEQPGLSCQATLPAGFSVDVGFELPRIDVGNYRKPYVVVWITDADRKLVKMLLISGQKPDYMADNYVWWRRYGRKEPTMMETMARPTRAPGRYTVRWDGTDQSGARAPQGTYTVNIEAAREHGGHSLQTIEVQLGAKAATGAATASDELGGAKVRYGRGR